MTTCDSTFRASLSDFSLTATTGWGCSERANRGLQIKRIRPSSVDLTA